LPQQLIQERISFRLNHIRDEIAPVEFLEIFQLLARADESRRNPKFVLNCDDDAALAAAVEFGRD
jgi:hypothetical protein